MDNLSKTQVDCLLHFNAVVDDFGWKFGAGTLTSLRKLGLLERFNEPERGHKKWRITESGRAEASWRK